MHSVQVWESMNPNKIADWFHHQIKKRPPLADLFKNTNKPEFSNKSSHLSCLETFPSQNINYSKEDLSAVLYDACLSHLV